MKVGFYNMALKRVIDSANRTFGERKSFVQHILYISATVFGIVVAFQDNQSECLYIRLLFVSSIILFALGILMLSLTLYAYVKHAYNTHKELCNEYGKLMNGLHCDKIINIPIKNWVKLSEKLAYIFLTLGLFALVFYAVMQTFY